jgi:hypothetical protein
VSEEADMWSRLLRCVRDYQGMSKVVKVFPKLVRCGLSVSQVAEEYLKWTQVD